ncbi:SusC/RagA family TonB-linked outer membrane protein [Sphingobacterium anhuiense]|uniref:SusC/RagA family TonB-linked outer membrane protein n=1 Tax=Sphingobacterium anhuiense TaxID=493780 RepID=UPI003C2E1E25
MAKLIFYLILIVFLNYQGIRAQENNKVTLYIVDKETNKPLEGATFISDRYKLKSDRNGQIALPKGKSTIKVSLSFTGYQVLDTLLSLQKDHRIALTVKISVIDEVYINTGFQKISKERAVGSYQVINEESLNRSNSTDILGRLKNVSNSVLFPDAYSASSYNGQQQTTPNLTVRGISTLRNQSQQPLIIVDNFPYEGNIIDISPNDVENISILKDAAATSIWGSKAGNGVIVITTKNGKGKLKQSLTVSSQMAWTEKPKLMQDRIMTSAAYIEFEEFLFDKGFYTSIETNRAKKALSPWIEALIEKRDGKRTADQLEQLRAELSRRDVRQDYLKHIYVAPFMQQYGVAYTDNNGKSSIRSSLNFDQNRASLEQNRYKRATFRTNYSSKITEQLQLTSIVGITWNDRSLTSSQSNYGYNLLKMGDRSLPPYIRFTDEDGLPISIAKDYRAGFIEQVSKENLLLDWSYNPILESQLNPQRQKDLNTIGSLQLNYKLLKGLDLEAIYQFQYSYQTDQDLNGLDSYFARDLINRFSQVQNNKVTYVVPKGGILKLGDSRSLSNQLRLQTQFNRTWGTMHSLQALAGMEIRSMDAQSNASLTYGYDDNSLAYSSALDFATRYPIYANLAVNSTINNAKSFSDLSDRFVSYYGNINYDYRNWIQVYASIRKDASNLFGVETNKKWTPLWSTGLSWNLKEFLQIGATGVDLLKIKGTFGYSGNAPTNIAAKTVLLRYPNSDTYNVNLPYAWIQNPPNENLRWEQVGTVNVGVDFSFWNNRLAGSLEFFRKNTKDLLAAVPLDLTSGVASMIMNSGTTRVNGVDLNLSSFATLKSIKWKTNLMLSFTENKVVDYYFNYASANLYLSSGITPVEGYQAFPIFSYKWNGLDPETGNPIGLFNGEPSQSYTDIVRNTKLEDLVYHGTARPRYFGNWLNSFSYGPLTLSANIGFYFDYYFRRNSINYTALVNSGSGHADYLLRWQKAGDELHTYVPSLQYPVMANRETFYTNSSILVERGDHIRVNDIRCELNLDKWLSSKYQISVHGGLNNIGILWRKNEHKLDPQANGSITEPRTVLFGVKIKL